MRRSGSTSFYQQDALGSVSSLSDDGAAPAQRYEYGAFGQRLTRSDSTGNPFSYTGREWDEIQKNYFLRERANDPASGRFISEDPIASAHLYEYADSNPISFRDPLGLFSMADQSATNEIQGDLNRSTGTSAQYGKELAGKVEYVFGQASGVGHNVVRSQSMLAQLQRVGIQNTQAMREYVRTHLWEVGKSADNIAKVQSNGRLLRESLLMGPRGALKVESIWGNGKLITVVLIG